LTERQICGDTLTQGHRQLAHEFQGEVSNLHQLRWASVNGHWREVLHLHHETDPINVPAMPDFVDRASHHSIKFLTIAKSLLSRDFLHQTTLTIESVHQVIPTG
jgi:hypothetical protein